MIEEGQTAPDFTLGVTRSTFIIDPEGRVAKVFPKVSPKTHDDVVLGALGELAAA